MSKKPPSKYRLTRENIWVARKRGAANGYGVLPADAFLDAGRRSAARIEIDKAIEQSWRRAEQASEEARQWELKCNSLIKKAADEVRLREDFKNGHSLSEGFVFTAMAYFRTTDARAAVNLAKEKTNVTKLEEEAAVRVQAYVTHWLKCFGVPENKAAE